jgi:hypothetical protein
MEFGCPCCAAAAVCFEYHGSVSPVWVPRLASVIKAHMQWLQ